MKYRFGNYNTGRHSFRPQIFTDAIKLLIYINIGIFILQTISGQDRILFHLFGIVPKYFWSQFMLWQPVTYLFFHGGLFHVLINMFILWMFGSELERYWGKKSFLKYYFLTGVGSGLITILFNLTSTIPVVGASGAIYGILLAYGLMFPNRHIYLYFLFPVKVKYFVFFIGLIAFFSSFNTGTNISHLTHLSGMLIGLAYLRSNLRWSLVKSFLHLQKDKIKQRYQNKEQGKINELRLEVDQILDKINQVGYDQLSDEEKDFLFDASKKLSRHEKRD